jgi:hypothetical protein
MWYIDLLRRMINAMEPLIKEDDKKLMQVILTILNHKEENISWKQKATLTPENRQKIIRIIMDHFLSYDELQYYKKFKSNQ